MAAGTPRIYSSAGYAASAVVRALPMTLQLASGFNPNAGQLFLLFFDLVAVPANGAVPKYSMLVPGTGSYSWGPFAFVEGGAEGYPFNNGCCYAVSSTGNILTLSASTFWVDVIGRDRS